MAQVQVDQHRLEEAVRQTTLPIAGAEVSANVSNSNSRSNSRSNSSSSMSNSSSCPASQDSSSSVSKSTALRVMRNASASSSSSSSCAVSSSSQSDGPPITMYPEAYTYSKQPTPVSQAKSSSSALNVTAPRWSVWQRRSEHGVTVYFVGKEDSTPVQLSPLIALTGPALTRCGSAFHPVAPPAQCMSASILGSF